MATKAWQLGSPETLVYRLFDGLRRRLNAKLVNYLTKAAVRESGKRVLEAGSGPAFASSMFACTPGVEMSIAVDIDHEALQLARLRDPSLSAVVADMCCLPFRDEIVDLAWNSSTVEHLPDPLCALKEMSRVTRKGGFVFVGVPYLYGPLGFQAWIPDTPAGLWIGTVFDERRLAGVLREAGLAPIDGIRYFFRFFIGLLARK